MSEELYNDELINIMTFGNSAVGKTSFILRFSENFFQDQYLTTIGFDFKVKTINIKNTQYKVIMFDTAGQEKYKSLASNIIKKAQGIIVIYDITNKSSFDSIDGIIKSILDDKGKDFPMILVGNKIDLEENRVITKEEGETLAEKYGLEFFEISIKEGINIEKAGSTIIYKILEKRKDDSVADTNDNSRKTERSYHSKFSNLDGDGSTGGHCC